MELDLDYRWWKVLVWIDNNINHTIIDWFFDILPDTNEWFVEFSYQVWKNTSRKFCNWVIVDFGEKIYAKYSHKYNLE